MKSSLELGIQAYKEGRYSQAIAILEAATQANPTEPYVWLSLARAYREAGQQAKAIASYRLALAQSPADSVLAEATAELAALNHASKVVIEEAMRPACGECGASLPTSRAVRPWCLCGWNTKTPPVVGRQIFLHDIVAYSAQRAVQVSFKRWEDIYHVAKSELRVQSLSVRTYPVDPRLALALRDRMAVLLQDELQPLQPEGGDGFLFRVRPLNQEQGGRYYNWRQFLAHLAEIHNEDVSLRQVDTSLGMVLLASGLLSAEALNAVRQQRQANESIGQALLRMRYLDLPTLIAGAIGAARAGPLPSRPFHDRLGERLIEQGLLDRKQLKQALFLQTQLKLPLGEVLIQAKLAKQDVVAQALAHQPAPSSGMPYADDLGELLVTAKLLSRTRLVAVRAEQERLGEYDLANFLR
ncbi:MAG: tetratricopeptide repeat protein, partial [Cyanobacteria bacterium NC_groundwater_1444_Ag_S-0.65um_54_12]|nr:tetratricopeptide repeat protein [Cyanobacteria bacterium NC_groundwater_1444_Ag_S-0.65um_54_12]